MFYNEVNNLMSSGRNTEARERLRVYLRDRPNDDYAYFLFGSASYREGMYAAAEKVFRELSSKPGADAGVHYSLGIALEQLGRIVEASEAVETCLRVNPNFPGGADKLKQLKQRQIQNPVFVQQSWNTTFRGTDFKPAKARSPMNPGKSSAQAPAPDRLPKRARRPDPWDDVTSNMTIPTAWLKRGYRWSWVGLLLFVVFALMVGSMLWRVYQDVMITRDDAKRAEIFACEQAQRLGAPIPPYCGKYGIP